MCHAIITVKYKSDGIAPELQTIKCETEWELEAKDKELQENDQVVSYRVYKYDIGRTRVSSWETDLP